MPNPHDIRSVLVVGSGPIVIGQGCEFDYSGTQAVRALKEEGIRVVLLNSNPATIMTDPELADATYIEPITVDTCISIIEKERCDAMLPTLGGQTALNAAFELSTRGILEENQVRLLGVDLDAILCAEDRRRFRTLALKAGCEVPKSALVKSLDEALAALDELGLPVIVRPSFTLGGSGSGMARDVDMFVKVVQNGLNKSPVGEVLLEDSVEGWKEFELEVMRDREGNNAVICSIENLDPMGTHTGDSITVAPVQTLSDKDYQRMRDAAFRIMNHVGICGGANVQFAINPMTGKLLVIEMNPRVSRSSALASKATGYPIAKISTKLALGYTLRELPNDIVGTIPACFEPALDYCVVKVPKWNFEKFKGVNEELSSQMKSIGEVMALGRTFNEALQKAFRGLEGGWAGLEDNGQTVEKAYDCDEDLRKLLRTANPARLFAVKEAFRRRWSIDELYRLTMIDPWFLSNIESLAETERRVVVTPFPCDGEFIRELKRSGFGDRQLADLWNVDEGDIRALRAREGVEPVIKMVDSCAGEFEAATPYYYITYDDICEAKFSDRRKVVILGSGPNRIGQGIEFDYCCVHAATELRNMGVETIMVNCNPETVSTDFDISDRLYFEPVTFEHVMAILAKEKPDGVVVQFGGQTPLKLIHRLHESGVKIMGTSVESVDRAEDRKRCSELLDELGILHPQSRFVGSVDEALSAARAIGYPVLLRPPYVLGGMAMDLVFNDEDLLSSAAKALHFSDGRQLMLDKFIEGAVEVDVDAVSDGEHAVVAGVMEHIEEAGIHSGDSSCILPPANIEDEVVQYLEDATIEIARALQCVGMLNVQFAVKDDVVYCIEINPRASRTVPFVSKATGIPWVKVAMRALVGEPLSAMTDLRNPVKHVAVKTPVMPFDRFPEVDSLLGPEMRATGEVMGIGQSFGEAFIKAQLGSGFRICEGGGVFISVANRHKRDAIFPAKTLYEMGYELTATSGTAKVFQAHGIPVYPVPKISSGDQGILEHIKGGKIALIINTPVGKKSIEDEKAIRLAANEMKIPCVTTMAGFHALVFGLISLRSKNLSVVSLQNSIGTLKEVA
jgi:carbamoyl-phosphate synthase large subunit